MPGFDFSTTRSYLIDFRFKPMFIEILGWSSPKNVRPIALDLDGIQIQATSIAQLAGIVVFEISNSNGTLPNAKSRVAIHKEISKLFHENLLIFIDKERTQSLWYWAKREGKRTIPREHLYVKGQPGDLFLGKLSAIFVDISELDEKGDINVIEVAQRLQKALDVERVTKKFFSEFADQRIQFLDLIQGIEDDHDRRWYASVLLNRLMFIYFLQKKKFVDNGDLDYLQRHLENSKKQGKDRYYADFLHLLFFEGFAKPKENRSPEARKVLGEIRYLSGSIFLPHPVEIRWPAISVPDQAFENLYGLFAKYSWNLDDTPGGKDDEINPDVLGYIFEKYINQKAFGAYYTRPEITEYLCEKTIYHLVLDAVNTPGIPGVLPARHFESIPELLVNLDAPLCRQLLFEVLPKMSLLDPACGSGAFLVAAMKTLINIYSAVIGRIEFLGDASLSNQILKDRKDHPSLSYYIKRRIITDNLYGVDIMEEATEITRVRLFLALVSSAQKMEDLEPLPNIDFNILPGNSLIGLLRVDEDAFNLKLNPSAKPEQGNLIPDFKQVSFFQKSYRQLIDDKKRQLETYRHTTQYTEDLQFLRDEIDTSRKDAYNSLNDLLLNEFSRLSIKYEQATWDVKKNAEEKPKKRSVQLQDIQALRPFHWGYEFDEVMNVRGGFDAIITNPPWEIFKPNAKEFFAEYSDLVTKKKMTIKEFEKEQAKLLTQQDLRITWLEYLSRFPHVSMYYRSSPQYVNQISIVNGKKAGTDINLYKLFVEQCYNLLKPNGAFGMVVPSGIYTDLGTKQLRELMFGYTKINGLFCFENRKAIFENVDSRFKFVVLTVVKGGETKNFPARFMRHDVKELSGFPEKDELMMNVASIRKLAPDSLSIPEIKSDIDAQIVQKMSKFPLLGEVIDGKWFAQFSTEFHITNDRKFFNENREGLPLYQGRMIYQYIANYDEPKFWIRTELVSKNYLPVTDGLPEYEKYRLAFRGVASSTNERTLISTILPRGVFGEVQLPVIDVRRGRISLEEQIYLVAVFNSFCADFSIRNRVSARLSNFHVYQTPIPRLTAQDQAFLPIVQRAARLICISPEYDDLAKAVGLGGYHDGVTDLRERARLQAELDGLIGHLYGLNDEEFTHIIETFPHVDAKVTQFTLEAFRKLTPDGEIAEFLANKEGEKLEFKQAAYVNPFTHKPDEAMKKNVAEAVSAFMNTSGGTLLIGVTDDGQVEGVEHEFSVANPAKKNWDGYQLALADVLQSRLSIATPFQYYRISQHSVYGKIVCRIEVKPAPEAVFIEKKLLIREGNRTRELQGPDMIGYVNSHWKKG